MLSEEGSCLEINRILLGMHQLIGGISIPADIGLVDYHSLIGVANIYSYICVQGSSLMVSCLQKNVFGMDKHFPQDACRTKCNFIFIIIIMPFT